MMTPEELLIERALEQEQRIMMRQKLLKELWQLRRSRPDNETMTRPGRNADERAPNAVFSRRATLVGRATSHDVAAALPA